MLSSGFFFLHFLVVIDCISWAHRWNKSGIFKDLYLYFISFIAVFIVIYQRDPVSSYEILGLREEQRRPCSVLAGPEESTDARVQFNGTGKWADNWSHSLLLLQQLILKLCWKQLDLIVLGLCRCTVSTGPCVERTSVLMAVVLVIAMVETSKQILRVFLIGSSLRNRNRVSTVFWCCYIISSNMINWKKKYDASY